jgi:hypothetical protein
MFEELDNQYRESSVKEDSATKLERLETGKGQIT